MDLAPKTYDDLWCDICGEQPQTGISADGVACCTDCQLKIMDKLAEAAGAVMVAPNRAQRRAMRKGQRLRKGYTR